MEERQRRDFRLTKAEHAPIERELARRTRRCRELARRLGRSPATASDEVRRNRTLARRASKGARQASTRWRAPASGSRGSLGPATAALQQEVGASSLSASRHGVNCSEELLRLNDGQDPRRRGPRAIPRPDRPGARRRVQGERPDDLLMGRARLR